MIRRWLIEKLGGEMPYDYDYEGDEDSYSFSMRLSRLFRRRNAILTNVVATNVRDMDGAITLLDPDTSLFQTMLSRLATPATARIDWMEDELFPRITPPRDDFGFGSWDDSIKPVIHMTVVPKPVYGTLMMATGNGKRYRFVGGNSWECQ